MGHQSIPSSQDELLALCLVMLAHRDRDHRKPKTKAIPPLSLSFECSICGKSFPTYQALGGHKSSHRRPTAPMGRPATVPSGSSGDDGGAHRCNVCYRGFATGQALGGHKRCHYWDASCSSGSSSSVRDFDLNFPPRAEPGWVEDGEEVQSPHPLKKLRQL